jgi:ribosomal protein S18 acetylase RimI-like enzyme
MLQVRIVTASSLGKCRKFLAQDPVANVLPLGDCYGTLAKVSTLYCAVEAGRVVGVCSVCHAFSKPSVVLGTAPDNVKRVLLEKALRHVPDEFLFLCPPAEVEIFNEYATITERHHEQQMVADPPRYVINTGIKVTRVQRSELERLNDFYRTQRSAAWIPLQFRIGPVYCVKQNGEIVSAAVTHIRTPQIAHLGSIVTDEAFRRRGFATACVSTLAAHYASRGQIVSLLVRTENTPAIQLYEKLGFIKKREVAFGAMRKSV